MEGGWVRMSERGSKTKRYHYGEYLENKKLRYKCNYCEKTYADNVDQLKNHFEKHFLKNETNINFPHSPKRVKNKSVGKNSSLNQNLNLNQNANLNSNLNTRLNMNLNSNSNSNSNSNTNSNLIPSGNLNWNEEKQSQAEKLLRESVFDASCENTLDLIESNLFCNFLKVLNPNFEMPSKNKVLMQKIQDLESNQVLQFSASQNQQQQLDKLMNEVEEIKKLLQARGYSGGNEDEVGDVEVVRKEGAMGENVGMSTAVDSGLSANFQEIQCLERGSAPPVDIVINSDGSDKNTSENTIVENNGGVIDTTNDGLPETQNIINVDTNSNSDAGHSDVNDLKMRTSATSMNTENNSDKNSSLTSDTSANVNSETVNNNMYDKTQKCGNSSLDSMVSSFQVAQAKTKRPITKPLQQAPPKKLKTQEVIQQGIENQIYQQAKLFQQAQIPFTSFQPIPLPQPIQMQPPIPLLGTTPIYQQSPYPPPNYVNQTKK